jgi:hypothetical protein
MDATPLPDGIRKSHGLSIAFLNASGRDGLEFKRSDQEVPATSIARWQINRGVPPPEVRRFQQAICDLVMSPELKHRCGGLSAPGRELNSIDGLGRRAAEVRGPFPHVRDQLASFLRESRAARRTPAPFAPRAVAEAQRYYRATRIFGHEMLQKFIK